MAVGHQLKRVTCVAAFQVKKSANNTDPDPPQRSVYLFVRMDLTGGWHSTA